MRRRPWAIWAVVIFQILLGITLILGALVDERIFSPSGSLPMTDETRTAYVVVGLIAIVTSLWLWTLSRRAWVLTMVIVGLGLAANLVLWWAGSPSYVRMFIQAITALYLNSAPIRELFLHREPTSKLMLRDADSD